MWTWLSSFTEERLLKRVIVDLSALLGPILIHKQQSLPLGFARETESKTRPLEFDDLWQIYMDTAGLSEDKLKEVFLRVAQLLAGAFLALGSLGHGGNVA